MLQKTLRAMGVWALAALLGQGACAATAEVTTPSGTVVFELPQGFDELSADEMAAKFGRNGRIPLKAYGNESRTSTVAVTWSKMQKQPLTQEALPQFMGAIAPLMQRVTHGLAFQEKAVVKLGARDWIFLRSTAPAADAIIHNHMYLTDLGGHMVGVNYNATAQDYAQQRAGFDVSAKTMLAKP